MSLWIQYQNDPRLPKTEEAINNVAVIQPVGVRVYGRTFKEAEDKAFLVIENLIREYQRSLDSFKKNQELRENFESRLENQ